jgi:hypothetical protein
MSCRSYSVSTRERQTGLDFFGAISQAEQRELESVARPFRPAR